MRDFRRSAIVRDVRRTAIVRDVRRAAIVRVVRRTAIVRDVRRIAIVRDVRRTAIQWWVKQTKRSVSDASRQRATKRKIKMLLWQYVSRKVMPLYFFSHSHWCLLPTQGHCKHHDSCDMTPEGQDEKHT